MFEFVNSVCCVCNYLLRALICFHNICLVNWYWEIHQAKMGCLCFCCARLSRDLGVTWKMAVWISVDNSWECRLSCHRRTVIFQIPRNCLVLSSFISMTGTIQFNGLHSSWNYKKESFNSSCKIIPEKWVMQQIYIIELLWTWTKKSCI